MIDFPEKEHYSVRDLESIVRILRAPGGCPWDGAQTHESIRRNFIEETLEACEAIDNRDTALLREELGDVLMQVIFHAGIEEDAGHFNLDDAADTACRKLIFRHPHIFGHAGENGEPLPTWDELKRAEKGQRTTGDELDTVARSLPGLWRAEKLKKKAARTGFDWPDVHTAAEKLREEADEVVSAAEGDGSLQEEIGDAIFAAVGVAVQAGLDPEECLKGTCEKFIRRFRYMEEAAAASGSVFEELTAEEQISLWNTVRAAEHTHQGGNPNE